MVFSLDLVASSWLRLKISSHLVYKLEKEANKQTATIANKNKKEKEKEEYSPT